MKLLADWYTDGEGVVATFLSQIGEIKVSQQT